MLWKVILVLGILVLLLGLLVTGICIALPIVTSGRTSWEEAAIGIVIGAVILIFGFFVSLLGAIFVIKGPKKVPSP